MEQDGDKEPAQRAPAKKKPSHHIRRPMNAFLIFCKRHRRVVREKHPNLENRSITKILGDWWSAIDWEEKASYTVLAKQYKDKFFEANPNFQWYKLPAPPLRNSSSRPRETKQSKHTETHSHAHDDHPYTKIENNNSTEYDNNNTPLHYDNGSSAFTPGKLADETQMGGISSLLSTKTETRTHNPYYSPHTYKYDQISKQETKPDSIQELQDELSETTKCFEHFKIDKQQDNMEHEKRYGHDECPQKNSSDEDKNMKSKRSCKGKRYQEFMAEGGLIGGKRQKSCHYDDGNTNNWEVSSCKSNSTDDGKVHQEVIIKEDQSENEDQDSNSSFKEVDFDLDGRIKALPSLSLEEYQQKKKANKRKKKPTNSKKVQPVKKQKVVSNKKIVKKCRENVIGSQKRKPRKISITRLDFNSFESNRDYNILNNNVSLEIKLATQPPTTMLQSMEMYQQTTHIDIGLNALATLAEVATSRIKDAAFLDKMADGNPSMQSNYSKY